MSRHMSKKKKVRNLPAREKEKRKAATKRIEDRAASLYSMYHHGSIVFFFVFGPVIEGRGMLGQSGKGTLCLVILCRPATKIRSRCFSRDLDERWSLLQIGPPEARKSGIAVLIN